MKTSDEGRSPSTKGSVSGQKVCGVPGNDGCNSSSHWPLDVKRDPELGFPIGIGEI